MLSDNFSPSWRVFVTYCAQRPLVIVLSLSRASQALTSTDGKGDNFGFEAVLKKGLLSKADITVWLNSLLDSKKGAPESWWVVQ